MGFSLEKAELRIARLAPQEQESGVYFQSCVLLGKHESWQPAPALTAWLFCVEGVERAIGRSPGAVGGLGLAEPELKPGCLATAPCSPPPGPAQPRSWRWDSVLH